MQAAKPPRYTLLVIVFSQAAGTSLWFAGNAVIGGIQQQIGSNASIALLTSIIQIGFICGTFVFAICAVADHYKASNVFALSALIAALANLAIICFAKGAISLGILRFITGFFLAGIYPIGMKIAADQFPNKLGNALGFLVGALVLGTSLPHLLHATLQRISWQWVLVATSTLAFTGGALIFWLLPSEKAVHATNWFKLSAVTTIFKSKDFRSASFGYFGHMWELYTFWAFVPFIIQKYNLISGTQLPVSLTSFAVIAFGSISCVVGGKLSKKAGSKRVAFIFLLVSALCCLLSSLAFLLSTIWFMFFLLIWSGSVIADSPQFSTLIAQTAPPLQKGTALTIVTSIGFAITIISIQIMQALSNAFGIYSFSFLALGPLIGLLFFQRLKKPVI